MACNYALEVWDRYARDGAVTYTDSIVGMHHVVDMALPGRAIAAIDRKLAGDVVDGKPIWAAYAEPISALQDDDLDLPTPIAQAYYAIYNLFGAVFELTKLYDSGEIVIAQADTGAGFLDEWWTRTWDAWASHAFTYPPSVLDRETFEAIANGTPASGHPRIRAALASIATGQEPRPVSDAIAIGPTYYAAFYEQRYVVRERATNRMCLAGTAGMMIRRVAFAGKVVILAGDVSDDIGPYLTVVRGEELDSRDYGYRLEHVGARRIVAVGPDVDVVAASPREVGVLSARGYARLGDGAVTGATFDETGELLATWATSVITIWRDRTKLRELDLGAEILDAVFGAEDLVVTLRGGERRVRIA